MEQLAVVGGNRFSQIAVTLKCDKLIDHDLTHFQKMVESRPLQVTQRMTLRRRSLDQ